MTAIITKTLTPTPHGTGHKQRCLVLTEHLEHPLTLWPESSAEHASSQFAPLNRPFHSDLSQTRESQKTHSMYLHRWRQVILIFLLLNIYTHVLYYKMFSLAFLVLGCSSGIGSTEAVDRFNQLLVGWLNQYWRHEPLKTHCYINSEMHQ